MVELTLENIKQVIDEGFEKQARLINGAFQEQKEHFDQSIDGLDVKIDKIDARLQIVEAKLDRALYTELIHLEARLRKVEEKIGIKPVA